MPCEHYGCEPLCSLKELEAKRIVAARTKGRELVVVLTPRGARVLRGLCPHQGAALSGGVLCGHMAAGEIAEYRLERVDEIVRCPWHGWEFDSETGRSLHDPEHTRVASYRSHICEGHVCLTKSNAG
jgi:nitrite reductase/ring-hydroxylating ferredoxin subunit